MTQSAQAIRGPASSSYAGVPPALGAAAPPPYVFWLFIAFLMLEYIRPPILQQLRLQFLLLIVLPLIWLRNPHDRPWSPLLTVQVLFLGLCISEIALGENWFTAYVTARTMYSNVAIAVLISWVFSTRTLLRRGLWAWLLIMTYVSLWAITHGGRGPGGFLGDQNDLALACVTALPFALFGIEWSAGWQRWLFALMGLSYVGGIVQSFSRGGFVGLAVVAMYCLLASRHKVRNAAILLTAGLFLMIVAPSSYIEELRSIPDTEESTARTRLFLWTGAINMWKDHPVLGVGGGSIPYQMGKYQPTGPEWHERHFQERTWAHHVHSLYLEMLAEHGAVGILLLVSLIWLHFRTLRHLRRDVRAAVDVAPDLLRDAEFYARALAAAMVGYMAAGAFLSVLHYPYAWYFSGMAVGLDVGVRTSLHLWRAVTCPSFSAHRS